METKEFISLLLSSQEWQIFECKRALAKPGKALESITALANSEGGLFVVGLEDPEKAQGTNRLIGISESPDNVSELLNLIHKEIDPPLKAVNTSELEITNAAGKLDKLLLIYIDPDTDIHSIKNDGTYVRRGRSNRQLTAREILQLKYAKGAISYEGELPESSPLEALDMGLVEKYKKYTGSAEPDVFELLINNGLAVRINEEKRINNAGLLLFAKNPSIALKRKCGIKITHYLGTQPNYSGEPNFLRRPFSVEGPLIRQIEEAFDYIKNWIETSPPRLEGTRFKNKYRYPLWVVHEAITNAVIHRDYSIQNDIQMRVFDDRIEIESPGVFAGNITISNIRSDRFARNPLIERTLNRFGDESPNLDIGEGVNRMFELMKEANLYDPLYLPPPFTTNSVLVILFNLEKISYWDTVSQYLDQFHKITNKELRKVTGIKDSVKASRLLSAWVKNKLLEKVRPSKKGTFYRRPGIKSSTALFSPPPENNRLSAK
ncbi:MAG: putative DNA binding domain-containing protein [Candidatus Saganbacteria bacterium]|nr:putative DNA binding domain-containing protein [Candidatus Saganbacteria bacterium]